MITSLKGGNADSYPACCPFVRDCESFGSASYCANCSSISLIRSCSLHNQWHEEAALASEFGLLGVSTPTQSSHALQPFSSEDISYTTLAPIQMGACPDSRGASTGDQCKALRDYTPLRLLPCAVQSRVPLAKHLEFS